MSLVVHCSKTYLALKRHLSISSGYIRTFLIGDHTDTAASAVTGEDDCCNWIELDNVLCPPLDVADDAAVDEVRRRPAVKSYG